GQGGLGRRALDAFLDADVHLPVADLEPEAAPLLEGGRLLDLPEPEEPAVEGPRVRDRVCRDRDLHVVDADDHPPSADERVMRPAGASQPLTAESDNGRTAMRTRRPAPGTGKPPRAGHFPVRRRAAAGCPAERTPSARALARSIGRVTIG